MESALSYVNSFCVLAGQLQVQARCLGVTIITSSKRICPLSGNGDVTLLYVLLEISINICKNILVKWPFFINSIYVIYVNDMYRVVIFLLHGDPSTCKELRSSQYLRLWSLVAKFILGLKFCRWAHVWASLPRRSQKKSLKIKYMCWCWA